MTVSPAPTHTHTHTTTTTHTFCSQLAQQLASLRVPGHEQWAWVAVAPEDASLFDVAGARLSVRLATTSVVVAVPRQEGTGKAATGESALPVEVRWWTADAFPVDAHTLRRPTAGNGGGSGGDAAGDDDDGVVGRWLVQQLLKRGATMAAGESASGAASASARKRARAASGEAGDGSA